MIEEIIFENVGLSFGANEIFRDVSLKLVGGQVIGITGKNGAGKSTFLKLAAKLIRPDTGEVKIFDGKFLSSREVRKKIAAIAPEMKIYGELSAEENLKFFATLRNKNLDEEKIFALGRRVGLNLEEVGKVRTENFSTGMKQRLKFAVLLSVEAEIWLLDEPTSNLDDDGRELFLAEIQKNSHKGRIILLATNDAADLKICDEIISLPFR